MVSAPFPTLQFLPFERIYCDEDALFLRPVRHRVLVIGRAVLPDFLLDNSYQYLCLNRCAHKKDERFTAYLVTLADLLKFRFQEFAGIKPFLIQNETVLTISAKPLRPLRIAVGLDKTICEIPHSLRLLRP